jgi:hypothetical protein
MVELSTLKKLTPQINNAYYPDPILYGITNRKS